MMNDLDLRELLQKLPRENAGENFTHEVMSRVDQQVPESTGRPWLIAAMIIGSVGAGIVLSRGSVTVQDEHSRENLLAQTEQLERDLDEIRNLVAEVSPEVELGSANGLKYVLAVDPGRESGLTPVVYEY